MINHCLCSSSKITACAGSAQGALLITTIVVAVSCLNFYDSQSQMYFYGNEVLK